MNEQQFAVVVLLLLVAVGGVAATVAGSPASAMEGDAVPARGEDAANNTTMGSEISAFMQSSAASAEGTVESGMWQARFDGAPANERPTLVTDRVNRLETRLERLEERRSRLLEGDDVTTADRARAARLAARTEALEDAIDGTARAAERADVNATRLEQMRTRARSLRGPAVAQMATGIAGNGPVDGPGVGTGQQGPTVQAQNGTTVANATNATLNATTTVGEDATGDRGALGEPPTAGTGQPSSPSAGGSETNLTTTST